VKRYRFRLEQVLRVRRIEEDREKAELLASRQAAGAARELLAARHAALAALPAEHAAGALGGSAWLADRGRRAALAGSAAQAGAASHEADAAVERQRAAYTVVAGRVTALERLDERGRDEHAVEARRDEDRVVDDVVVSRFRAAS
jgi:flagellar export protein FliJ